jgi:hypothetical protein
MDQQARLLRRVRLLLVLFMAALVLSGLTAVPLQWELQTLAAALGIPEGALPEAYDGLRHWIALVRNGIEETNARYPFMAYGTDWLAFAHFTIAIAFIGPLRDPVRNVWVIDFGLIACALVVPMALVFGPIRGIPLYWRLIDCSFGILGFVPLWLCRRYVKELERGR